MCRILGFSIIGIRKLVVKLLFSGQMIAQPTVGEATDARHAAFFEWLVEWRNVGNFYEFAGPYPILQGVTAREAGSLPYRGAIKGTLTAKMSLEKKHLTFLDGQV